MYQRTHKMIMEESKWRPLNRDEEAEGLSFMSLIMYMPTWMHQIHLS